MLETAKPQAILFRRSETGFDRQIFDNPDSVIELNDLEIELALGTIFRDMKFESDAQSQRRQWLDKSLQLRSAFERQLMQTDQEDSAKQNSDACQFCFPTFLF